MNVHRQAYFGGTFIGNHVHKCLKVGNYKHTLMLLIKILLTFLVYSQKTSIHFAPHP